MDIVQLVNSGNQVINAAGMSVSGILTNLEMYRGLLYKGIMAGGFVLQQKRGIYFFLAMVVSAIFRFIETFSRSGSGPNDGLFVNFLKSIQYGFGRLFNQLSNKSPEYAADKYHGQDILAVVVPITDSYWPKPWAR